METSVLKSKISFLTIFTDLLKSMNFFIILSVIFVEFLFTDVINLLFFDNANSDSLRILKALTQILITIPFSILIYVFIYWVLGSEYQLLKEEKGKNDFLFFLKSNLLNWVLIQVRSFARVILYSFLFIVPGLIENVRLAFSSLYVFYDDKMKDPYFDPIIESRIRIQPFSSTTLLLFLLSFVAPIALSLIFSDRSFFSQPHLRLLHTLTVSTGFCLGQSFIFYTFINFHNANDLTFHEE